MKSQKSKSVFNRFVNIVIWIIAFVIFVAVIRVFVFSTFKIPSASMSPTLIEGDNIIVSKVLVGAKLFNLNAALRGEDVAIYHMPAISSIKRNDILVYYYPYPDNEKIISLNPNNYHVKRCVALPGDSLEIKDCYYRVRRVGEILGNKAEQDKLALLPDSLLLADSAEIYPNSLLVSWNKKNFGVLYIPCKDATIEVNELNIALYGRLIEWEQQNKLQWINQKAYINNKQIDNYTFQKNYYFMAGDNVADSHDSRYWGLLPEEFVVGKAWFIWRSVDKQTNTTRCDRLFKSVN